ncbi:hypothetical protein ACIQGO_07550 [Streptomyces shenzhenensis]|uniref:hypothetical protein n=1 Tax=Streptomyces shenzhenensis TaxID=943815 RepID=UPI00380F6D28
MGAKYREQIIELLGSPEWDLSDDAFMAAVSDAGEILHDAFDAELLRTLLKLAEEGRGEYDDDLVQRLAVEAIARALGGIEPRVPLSHSSEPSACPYDRTSTVNRAVSLHSSQLRQNT